MSEKTSTATARLEPTGPATTLRLSGGVALIFLCFATMNLLSRSAATEAIPYAAAESPTLPELNDNPTPDVLEIFDNLDEIQPDQPADSSGALPPEDPETGHI